MDASTLTKLREALEIGRSHVQACCDRLKDTNALALVSPSLAKIDAALAAMNAEQPFYQGVPSVQTVPEPVAWYELDDDETHVADIDLIDNATFRKGIREDGTVEGYAVETHYLPCDGIGDDDGFLRAVIDDAGCGIETRIPHSALMAVGWTKALSPASATSPDGRSRHCEYTDGMCSRFGCAAEGQCQAMALARDLSDSIPLEPDRTEVPSDDPTLEDAYAEGRADELEDCKPMLAWAYGKLHHVSFRKQDDALMLDRIKLLLERDIHG